MRTKYLKKKRSCCCESESESKSESSAEKVGSNDDLINEILLELPASSLVRFKSVSKQWRSLITSPHLSRLHILRPLRVSGLFIPIDKTLKQTQYRYIPLNSSIPSRTITFPTPAGPNGITILQSCNGLLFCTNSYDLSKYYVYNPTTGKFTTISFPPPLARKDYHTVYLSRTLAFDPLRSPHYKIVCARWIQGNHQMVVYSSETQLWKVCGVNRSQNSLTNGVYFNGAVHYTGCVHTIPSIYLKIDDEDRLETMQMPPIPNNNQCIYFGQSGGRLHLIMVSDKAAHLLDVYEMENDYSKWCLRYLVEIREVCWSYIIGIVPGEREEDSFLLFTRVLDGFIRFMKYTFADKTLKMLFEIQDPGGRPGIISYPSDYSKAFEFFQSLSPV